MSQQWKIGDVVQLKSGGPQMTVTRVHHDGDVDCQWFYRTDAQSGTFPAGSVQAYQQPPVSARVVSSPRRGY